jgi:decaprenylphospho-beta-D-erythro-pentofuranosid-2-ulose 2-reductase
MNVVVFGATKGMGRAVARGLAARGDRVHLLGRDLVELRRAADDLGVRAGAPGTVTFSACDLALPETFASALDGADSALGGIHAVVVTAGVFATQDVLEQDEALTSQVLTLDFVNTVLFCEAVRKRLLASGGGTLCVFSSVAGERGRKPVVLYGAAKAGLSRYLEGLDHRFRDRGLRTVCVKPGFVKTSMTAGLAPPPFAVDADAVVAPVLNALDNGAPVIYVPGIWRYIMLVIRTLPRAVMRRLSF